MFAIILSVRHMVISIFRLLWTQAAFPTQEKKLDALIFCASEVFEYLEENLKLTQKSMADLAAASDELTEMHQRVCACMSFNC